MMYKKKLKTFKDFKVGMYIYDNTTMFRGEIGKVIKITKNAIYIKWIKVLPSSIEYYDDEILRHRKDGIVEDDLREISEDDALMEML